MIYKLEHMMLKMKYLHEIPFLDFFGCRHDAEESATD